MIDIERRKKLALHLRHLSVGVISNDEFEENLMDDVTYNWLPEQYHRSKEAKFDDPIIIPLLELCWGLYDDTRCQKLTGYDKLTTESLKIISRCILFLHSDQEYKWPYFDSLNPIFKFSLSDFFFNLLSFGKIYRDKRLEQKKSLIEFKKTGDFDFWPFLNKNDYELQLLKQPFLHGKL